MGMKSDDQQPTKTVVGILFYEPKMSTNKLNKFEAKHENEKSREMQKESKKARESK